MVSFNLICVIFNFDCSDGFDSDDSFDSYPPLPLLLKQDTPVILELSSGVHRFAGWIKEDLPAGLRGFAN